MVYNHGWNNCYDDTGRLVITSNEGPCPWKISNLTLCFCIASSKTPLPDGYYVRCTILVTTNSFRRKIEKILLPSRSFLVCFGDVSSEFGRVVYGSYCGQTYSGVPQPWQDQTSPISHRSVPQCDHIGSESVLKSQDNWTIANCVHVFGYNESSKHR